MPIHILMLTDSLKAGGKERRLVELLKELSTKPDICCHLAIIDHQIHYQEIYQMNVKVHLLRKKIKKDPRIFYQLYRLCQTETIDIMHTWGAMPVIYGLPVAKLLRIKLVNSLITNAPSSFKLLEERHVAARLTFPFSDAILSNSQAGIKAYQAPSHKSFCIYNGFDFARVQDLSPSADIRARFSIQTKHVVSMVGAFEARKDYITFIKAALRLLDIRDDVTFLCIGGGDMMNESRALVPERWRDRIVFTGRQRDVESIVNASTACVLLTNQEVHGEGISNAVMEYMALAKPVVATRGGGTAELVDASESGFLVQPNSVDELTEKLTFLLNNPREAQVMGEAGRKIISDRFSLDKMIEAYYNFYHTVLTSRRPRKLELLG